MKRIGLIVLLFPVMLVESYLCSAFLPVRWQLAMQHGLSRVLPQTYDHSIVTHPALDQELEEMFRKNVVLRFAFYLVLLGLLVGNTLILIKILKALRSSPPHRETPILH